MPRKKRFYIGGTPAHLIQRGNNRQTVFFHPEDCSVYLGYLRESAMTCDCQVHAYVLMTNHVHLLITPRHSTSISRLMQQLGRRYVAYFNRKYRRTGTLWEGRHRGCIIEPASYGLRCYRYIELNPLRAGIVRKPAEYRWSSYQGNADGCKGFLAPLPQYQALGATQDTRQKAYRQFLRSSIPENEIDTITACAQAGTVLGSACFKSCVERELGVKIGYVRPGRPASNSTRS